MARYTFTLQELESLEGHDNIVKWFKAYDLRDYLTPEEILVIRSRDTWNEDKLAELAIKHYYIREIGLETPALFKLKLEVALKEIMEEKAPLIYSASIKVDPMNEFEVNETTTSNSTTEVENKDKGLQINSTTPQGQIDKEEILDGTYASSTVGTENEGTSESSNKGDTKRVSSGRNQTQARLIQEYRNTIRMINREIITDISDLFLGLY